MARPDHLHGALELLVLTVLRRGPNHGYAIATLIGQTSASCTGRRLLRMARRLEATKSTKKTH